MVHTKTRKLFRGIAVILIFFIQLSGYSQDMKDSADTISTVSDTVTKNFFPEKVPPRKPWEYVVSMPIWIVTSPLYLAYRGIAATIGFVDDHNIPQTIERVLISEDGTREIMPDYSSRTGVGVSYSKTGLITKNSELYLSGSYWLRHRNSVKCEFTDLAWFDHLFFTDFKFYYEYVPDDPFFGIGPATPKSSEMNYTHRGLGGSVAIGKRLIDNITVHLEGSLNHHKISEGEDEEFPSIDPSHHCEAVLAGLTASITLDTRDRKDHPTKGTRLVAFGGFFDEIRKFGGYDRTRKSVYGYTQLSADLTQYFHLPWSKGRVLALRGAFQTKEENVDKKIPFYLLSEIGSDETIRGFSRDRFREKDAFLASAEYRYPIWENHPNSMDAFVFVDAGQVSDNIFGNFRKDNTHIGYGLGLRFYNDEKDDLMAKISFGFSEEEFRIVFALED